MNQKQRAKRASVEWFDRPDVVKQVIEAWNLYVRGNNYDQIATQLAVSHRTVSRHIVRARSLIRGIVTMPLIDLLSEAVGARREIAVQLWDTLEKVRNMRPVTTEGSVISPPALAKAEGELLMQIALNQRQIEDLLGLVKPTDSPATVDQRTLVVIDNSGETSRVLLPGNGRRRLSPGEGR